MASTPESRTPTGIQDCDPLMGMDCQSATNKPLHVVPVDLVQALPPAVLLYTLGSIPTDRTDLPAIVSGPPARDVTVRALRTTRLLI